MKVLALALLLVACDRAETPDRSPSSRPAVPSGVVLRVDGLELRAAEVAPLAADIQDLYPEYSALHARRLALTNEWLPRLACRASEPAAWASARAACEHAGERLDAVEPMRAEGTFRALGLGLWSAARHLPIGAWSEPVELTGRWLRIRLEERTERPEPQEEVLRIAYLEFPWIDPARVQESIDAAVDGARLTLLDPEYAEAVPESWKHRMHASTP